MEEFEWSVHFEGQLLEAMVGHKPVGLNKHFQMAFICEKFGENNPKEIDSDKIWQHLETMYNLEALDESEAIPFPNSEKEFVLPDSDFAAFIAKKEEEKRTLQKSRETPKAVKEIKREDKTPSQNSKEVQRRDSKDSKDKTPASVKKDVKKEREKNKNKGKSLSNTPKEADSNSRSAKTKGDDQPKPTKRPTRGSLKPDDSSSSGKSSPVTVPPSNVKRRRI